MILSKSFVLGSTDRPWLDLRIVRDGIYGSSVVESRPAIAGSPHARKEKKRSWLLYTHRMATPSMNTLLDTCCLPQRPDTNYALKTGI